MKKLRIIVGGYIGLLPAGGVEGEDAVVAPPSRFKLAKADLHRLSLVCCVPGEPRWATWADASIEDTARFMPWSPQVWP